jgi:hypothetical protein
MKLNVEQLEGRTMPAIYCGVSDTGVAFLDSYTYGDHHSHVLEVGLDNGHVKVTVDGHSAVLWQSFESIRIQVEGGRNITTEIQLDPSLAGIPVRIVVGKDGNINHRRPHGGIVE